MRILYFSRSYTTHDRRFLTAMAEALHEVFFLRLENDSSRNETLPPNVRPVLWPGQTVGEVSERTVHALLPALQQVLDEVKPDLVHAGPIPTCAFLVAKSGFHPLMAMSWGSDILFETHEDAAARDRALVALRHADWIVCDCDAVRLRVGDLAPIPENRIVQFPWGVDLEHYGVGQGTSKERALTRTVFSNRAWSSIYDIPMVLESFRLAHERDPRLCLVLMGDGPGREEVHAFIAKHRLEDIVRLPGRVPSEELPHFYRDADVYLSCSRSDGTSVSLLEAMASGLPVVVTDAPGNREWVSAQGGFLAKTPTSFAEALVHISHLDDDAWRALSSHNRAVVVERADWKKNVKLLLRAYDAIADHEGTRS